MITFFFVDEHNLQETYTSCSWGNVNSALGTSPVSFPEDMDLSDNNNITMCMELLKRAVHLESRLF
jgi:hypothetical protein